MPLGRPRPDSGAGALAGSQSYTNAPRPVAAPRLAAPAPPRPTQQPADPYAAVQAALNAATAAPPPAPPQHPVSLAEDPGYQAYLRQVRTQEGNAEANTQSQIDQINNRTNTLDIPQLQQQGKYALQGLDNTFVTRGAQVSSQRDQADARQMAANNQAIATTQANAGDRVAALRAALASQKADLETRLAGAGLPAASNLLTTGF